MKKVLIIKPGYSETLDPDDSGVVSLGDVLRTTVILHLFPPEAYEVMWVTDKKAAPLLKNNPFINKVLTINTFTPHLLLEESYDILINLEKDLGICAMCEKIKAWERYGFRLKDRQLAAHEYSEEALTFTRDEHAKRNKGKSWSEVLYEMLGFKYNGESYILSAPKKVGSGVGLNYKTGGKFNDKSWGLETWIALLRMIDAEIDEADLQPPETTLDSYICWINSKKVIITNDSLGLHIALALNKKVIALFGPTLASEVHSCKNLIKINSKTGNIYDIKTRDVMKELEKIYG